MKKCNNIYEGIATDKLPSRVIYKNFKHGVMVVLDPRPVTEGHLGIASIACASSVDALKSRSLHNKLTTVAQFAGKALEKAFPDAPYIGQLMAHNQIRHPHIHRFPGDEDADAFKRFSKLPDWPRLQFSPDHMDDIQSQLTSSDEMQELWQVCNNEVVALGAPDEATARAVQELGLVLP